jgi:hypothetical protein
MKTLKNFLLPISGMFILLVFAVPAQAAITPTAFSEICLDPGGNQLNGGSDTNVVAGYTSVNGVWDGTSIFVPTDGSTPATTLTNQFASVYIDGATIGVYLARVVSVSNIINGGITLSTTAKCGTVPSVSATSRSIKIGGALKGPNGAGEAWPINTVNSNLVNTAGSPICINLRGTGAFTSSSSFTNTQSQLRFSGYTNSFRDGGKCNINGSTTGAAYGLFVNSGAGCAFLDLDFATNGATASAALFANTGANVLIKRCIARESRGDGIKTSSGGTGTFESNEEYHCGLNNSSGTAGLEIAATAIVRSNNSHNNSGANVSGILTSVQVVIVGSVCASNGLNGITHTSATTPIYVVGNEFYANAGSGIDLTGNGLIEATVENNNFFKQGAWAFTSSGSSLRTGSCNYNSFGAGSQANASGDLDSNLGAIRIDATNTSYPINTTPWLSPDTGDWTLINSLAIGTGGQTITSTMTGLTNSLVGFPPRGALVPANSPKTYSFPFAQ